MTLRRLFVAFATLAVVVGSPMAMAVPHAHKALHAHSLHQPHPARHPKG